MDDDDESPKVPLAVLATRGRQLELARWEELRAMAISEARRKLAASKKPLIEKGQ